VRSIQLFIVILFIVAAGCRITRPLTVVDSSGRETVTEAPAVDFSSQSTWLLGYINPFLLTRPPHSEWYIKGYDNYHFNQDIVKKLQVTDKNDLTIKIVMGTWCPDSRREVPRFMRILDSWKFPSDKITLIGVDNAKLSTVREYDTLNIARVPTFIIYINNVEAGRIIENPVTSLEQDILNIITRNEK